MLRRLDEDLQLTGTVTRVLYTNEQNHWTVLTLKPESDEELHQGLVTVVGTMAGVRENERLTVMGHFELDPRRGRRFRMVRYQIALPVTRAGIERYLASGLIPGIGPKTAELLVKRFGEQTLEVIRRAPERLRAVKGVGQKKVAEIVKAFREHAGQAELLAYLQGLGASLNLARRLYELWGDAAVSKLRANPWVLADELSGVGFARADAIAEELGLGGAHPERVSAGLAHVLDDARREGQTALPRPELVHRGERLLKVDASVAEAGLEALISAGKVVAEVVGDGPLCYLAELHRAESRVAKRLLRLLGGGTATSTDELTGLAIAESEEIGRAHV